MLLGTHRLFPQGWIVCLRRIKNGGRLVIYRCCSLVLWIWLWCPGCLNYPRLSHSKNTHCLTGYSSLLSFISHLLLRTSLFIPYGLSLKCLAVSRWAALWFVPCLIQQQLRMSGRMLQWLLSLPSSPPHLLVILLPMNRWWRSFVSFCSRTLVLSHRLNLKGWIDRLPSRGRSLASNARISKRLRCLLVWAVCQKQWGVVCRCLALGWVSLWTSKICIILLRLL